MAREPKPKEGVTPAQAIAEAKARYKADLQQRLAAKHILDPQEVGGAYNAGRALDTILNGQLRKITAEDLQRFAALAKSLGKKFAGGITAKQIINLAHPERRQRANTEIHYAVPMEIKGSVIHFTTSASPGSRAARHHVYVDFVGLSGATAAPAEEEQLPALARQLATGSIRIDCDCEDWRFVFRYIATVGNYNSMRPETGFPKIRNPQLDGVACKHVLRTVHLLTQPIALQRIEQMIKLARGTLDRKATARLKKAQADDMALEQMARKDWKRTQIETTEERTERLAAARAIRAAAASQAAKTISPGTSERDRKVLVARAQKHIEPLVAMGVMTREAADAMYAQATKG
ncbi:hypothetical protein [Sphaerotilus sp.]|uniref:hypothetical protein n=1 Tax=Sphaerotilus sp. TaxID=2093942 RepID=UPI0025F68E58|nr:hypothetical protein [Sphaerotilus sp.]